MQQYTSHSLEETLSIARQLGRFLKPGTVVAYLGGLGMGKTAFTAGLAQGMGIEDSVSSPTFSLVNVYYGHPTDLVHFELFDVRWEHPTPTTPNPHQRPHHTLLHRGPTLDPTKVLVQHVYFMGGASVSIRDLMGVHNGVTGERREVELSLNHNAGKLKVLAHWTGVIP